MTNDPQRTLANGAVLLLGNYRAALAVARELAPNGYPILVTRGGGEGATELSRFVHGVWDEPCIKSEGEAAFVDALAAFLNANPQVLTVLPVAEPYVAALARHGDRLPKDRLLATPAPDTVLTCLDKPTLFEHAAAHGVPFARTAIVNNHADLLTQTADLGYPIVIRPLVSETRLLGEKALTLDSEAALLDSLPAWPAEHHELIVQQKVRGLRVNVYFAASKGELVRVLQATILETDRNDGSGLAVSGATEPPSPDLLDHTKRMAAALDYHGVGCAQFLVDRKTGAVNFLEINPRIAGHHAVTTAAGLDLASLAITLASGTTVDSFRTGQAAIKYSWTYGALRGMRHRARGRWQGIAGVARALWRAAGSDLHMTWRWSDPMPTLALYAKAVLPNRSQQSAQTPKPAPVATRGSTSNA